MCLCLYATMLLDWHVFVRSDQLYVLFVHYLFPADTVYSAPIVTVGLVSIIFLFHFLDWLAVWWLADVNLISFIPDCQTISSSFVIFLSDKTYLLFIAALVVCVSCSSPHSFDVQNDNCFSNIIADVKMSAYR